MAESTVVYIPAANPTGSGVANRGAYWTAAGTLGSAAGFTFDGTGTLTLSVAVITPVNAFGTTASLSTGYITSTSHATKGKYFLNAAGTITVDDLNVRIGVGLATPLYDIHVQKTSTGGVQILSENVSTGTAAYSYVIAKNSTTSQAVTAKLSSGYAATVFGETAANMGIHTNQISGIHVVGNQANEKTVLITNSVVRLTINAAGGFIVAEANDFAFGTTTGTKIGTATSQKIGFYNATPIVQGASVADATDAGSAITQLNALISRIEALGLIATV